MTLAERQAATAREMGCPSVEALNAEHDPLHVSLMEWLGTHSRSLREAAGEKLDDVEQRIAWDEEAAVMSCQRLIWTLRNSGVKVTL